MDLFGTNLFRIFTCVFAPTFCDLVDYLWLLLENSFEKLVTNPLFGWEFCVVQQDTFDPHQVSDQGNFYRISHLYFVGRSIRDGQFNNYLQLIQNWNVSSRIWPDLLFFNQHSQQVHDVMQKEIDNLEFVQGVNFEIRYSLENNGTK